MKDIYPLLFDKKREIGKCIFFVALFCVYRYVYDFAYDVLCNLVGISNICYVSRILLILILCGGFVYLRISFIRFYKKNWESLILLGYSKYKLVLLFFFTKYAALLSLFYFSTITFLFNNIYFGRAIVANVLNTMLICVLALLSRMVNQSKKVIYIYCILAGVLGELIVTEKLSYNNSYAFVTSNTVSQILFSDNDLAVFIKIIVLIIIGGLVVLRMKCNGIEIEVEESDSKKKLWTKDLLGKIYSKSPSIKNYVWIYKDKDFILWKFFSTILFGLICCKSTSLLFLFILSYAISLISTFYFKDVYHFECSMFFHYVMSDYSYAQVSRDLFISGFLVIGDNLLLIIFISCFFRPVNLILLLGIPFVIGFMTIFLNSQLFARYPVKQNYLHLICILIRFHIPIFNIFFLVKDTEIGKNNWESMSYE